ncbi:hypothetical protein [Deinococcus multiflagellatus]|uniref:VOC domain-containing protein n=1 Tax=Deinococcus multiflagellatus TaxID=1656887 RepID=A0ABW1ZNC4_9DEIO
MTFITGLDHVLLEAPAGANRQRVRFTARSWASPKCPSLRSCKSGAGCGLPCRTAGNCTLAWRPTLRRASRATRRCAAPTWPRSSPTAPPTVSPPARTRKGVPRVFLHDPFGNRLEVVQG